jgi:hypothetical protein
MAVFTGVCALFWRPKIWQLRAEIVADGLCAFFVDADVAAVSSSGVS